MQQGILVAANGREIAIALEIPSGEDKDSVVRVLAEDIKAISTQLEQLPQQETLTIIQGEEDEVVP